MASIAQLRNPPSRDPDARNRIIPKSVRRDYERFLEAVRARREELGMTQRELGCRIGLSGSHAANIERGHAVPSVVRLLLLARALKVTPAALVAPTRRRSKAPRSK
jgi:ribosome-binding protein aMBF1 (putative translation factor)